MLIPKLALHQYVHNFLPDFYFVYSKLLSHADVQTNVHCTWMGVSNCSCQMNKYYFLLISQLNEVKLNHSIEHSAIVSELTVVNSGDIDVDFQ